MQHLITAPGFYRYGQFVLSGLLRSQARQIEHVLYSKPVEIIRKWEHDGTWHTFYGRCHASIEGITPDPAH